jgi:hypothetical protein
VTVLKKDPEGQGEFSTVQQNEEQALMEHEANSPIRASQLPAPAAKTKAPATQIPAQTVHTTDEVWIDPATGLMWTGKDNGSDMNWQQAMDYCQSLQLAGYSDWRLPTIDELQGIYDQNINLPGQCCGGNQVTFHVKGNLQLSGWHWSSSPGDASGTAWYFPFNKMIGRGSSRLVNRNNWRALCVRRSGTAVDRSVPTEPPPPPRAPVPAKRPTPRPSGLDGDWRNVDPNTRSIVEIIIAGKDIHPYGACRPNACDMGVITAESFASSTQSSDISKLVAKKNQGFSQIEISLSLEPDGRLRAEKFTHFTDGSGRADYSSVDYFNRSGPLNNP